MPGLSPIVGDIVRMRVLCSTPDQIGLNVTHWRVVSRGGSGATLAQLAEQLDTNVAAAYRGWIPAQATYRGVGAQNLTGDPSIEQTATTREGPGTVGAGLLPTQTSGILGWKTASAGRHFRGRIYPPFPRLDFADESGKMNAGGAAALGALRAAYNLLIVATIGVNTTTMTMVILHRPTDARPIPPNSLTTDVTEKTVDNEFATQRRRGQFGRLNVPPF